MRKNLGVKVIVYGVDTVERSCCTDEKMIVVVYTIKLYSIMGNIRGNGRDQGSSKCICCRWGGGSIKGIAIHAVSYRRAIDGKTSFKKREREFLQTAKGACRVAEKMTRTLQ